jgi:hypothetical protein
VEALKAADQSAQAGQLDPARLHGLFSMVLAE